jgi:hypothetical protein
VLGYERGGGVRGKRYMEIIGRRGGGRGCVGDN